MSFRIHQDPVAVNLHALVCHRPPVEEKKSDAVAPIVATVVPTIVEPEKELHAPGPAESDQVVMRIKRRGAGTGKLSGQ